MSYHIVRHERLVETDLLCLRGVRRVTGFDLGRKGSLGKKNVRERYISEVLVDQVIFTSENRRIDEGQKEGEQVRQ